MHNKWDPNSISNNLRVLIVKNIEFRRIKDNSIYEYQIFLFELMLRLITYFQPFDIKLSSMNQVDSEIKAYQFTLGKTVANNFIRNIHNNHVGVVVSTQIRKRLFTQFQILKEMEESS